MYRIWDAQDEKYLTTLIFDSIEGAHNWLTLNDFVAEGCHPTNYGDFEVRKVKAKVKK